MSWYRDVGNRNCQVYVGDLGSSFSKEDLVDVFSIYGPIRNVWMPKYPSGFAFVEFQESHYAKTAVRELDGRTVCGHRVRVEMSKSSRRGGFGYGGRATPHRHGRPFHPEDRCYLCGERGHYARNCRCDIRRGSRGRNRSRSRSRSRTRSRSPLTTTSSSSDRSRSSTPVRVTSTTRNRRRRSGTSNEVE